MTAAMLPTSFQDIEEADQIGVGVSVGIVDRVTNASLGGEVNDRGEAMLRKQSVRGGAIGEIDLHETEMRQLAQDVQPRPLQRRIVVAVQIIQAHNMAAFGQQPAGDMKSDKS